MRGVEPLRPNPKSIGERSEGFVLSALFRAGYTVLVAPFSDNARYDLVLDLGDRFARVQVKTGRLVNGVVVFPTSSSQAHRGRGRQHYRGQCEFFAVYCSALDRTYLVPVDLAPAAGCKLRVEPSRNKQQRRVLWAADYELRPFLDWHSAPCAEHGERVDEEVEHLVAVAGLVPEPVRPPAADLRDQLLGRELLELLAVDPPGEVKVAGPGLLHASAPRHR